MLKINSAPSDVGYFIWVILICTVSIIAYAGEKILGKADAGALKKCIPQVKLKTCDRI